MDTTKHKTKQSNVSAANNISGAVTFFVVVMLALALSLFCVIALGEDAPFAINDDNNPAPISDDDSVPDGDDDEAPDAYVGRYAYNTLSEDDKSVYKKLDEEISRMGSVSGLVYMGDIADLNHIIKCVYYDKPEYFWFGGGCSSSYISNPDGSKTVDIWFDYIISETERDEALPVITEAGSKLVDTLSGKSDFDKAKGVYDYLTDTIVYDMDYMKGNTLYFVMNFGRGVCGGYARAAQYLFNLQGIECMTVSSADHAWNIVKLDGEYYQFDATWGDQKEYIDYSYLNFDDKTARMLDSHEIIDDITWPECSAQKDNYFVHEGLVFDALDKDKLSYAVGKANGAGVFAMSFSSPEAYSDACKWLNGNREVYDVLADAGYSNKTYRFSCSDKTRSITVLIDI